MRNRTINDGCCDPPLSLYCLIFFGMFFFLLFLMVPFFAAAGKMPVLRYERHSELQEQPLPPCQCVSTDLCADNEVAIDGQGLMDIRIDDNKCQNHFEICCDNPIEVTTLPQTPIIQSNFKGCGYKNPIGVAARITNKSTYALFGELPWSTIILLLDALKTERNLYKCGGSLIHPQVVLTAAHCVQGLDVTLLSVRVGEWNIRSQDEPIPHQNRLVDEVLIHPHFEYGSMKNDIALVFLTEPVVLTDNIGLICLPLQNFYLDSGTCTASGWGRNDLATGHHTSILKKVDLPLVPIEKCNTMMRQTRLGMFYKLHKSFICAGGETNKDTCKGDGGGPLICNIPGKESRFFQIGIVSWGIGCGESNIPGVYVNVPLFTDWIDKQLYKRELDPSLYKY